MKQRAQMGCINYFREPCRLFIGTASLLLVSRGQMWLSGCDAGEAGNAPHMVPSLRNLR